MFNHYQDPRLNGRGVPRALGGDGRGNEEDLKRAEVFEEESRLGTIRGLKNTRTLSTFGAYGSAASGQLEGVAFFTITRLASDWGISALNGQDNMAIYRHGIIDLGTSFYPNPSIAPAGMIIRIYLKKEGDNYATSY